MEKIITIENLHNFAYCNDNICKESIKGLVVFFRGLGDSTMVDENVENGDYFAKEGVRFAEHGILYLVPYQNPWAWQNKQNVFFTDEIIDVLFKAYNFPTDFPIVSVGVSMGGLSAITYMAYAKRTPIACVANCPVCDLVYHFTERPDLPRTLYSAFYNYDCSLNEALKTVSPLELIKKLPVSSKYYIFHGEEDKAVNKQKHSDRFVEKMKEQHNILYYPVPNKGHCQLTDEMAEIFYKNIISSIIDK